VSYIYKYKLEPHKTQIRVDRDSHVLHAGAQGDDVFVWIKHAGKKADFDGNTILTFIAVPTGVEFDDDDFRFAGTVTNIDGWIVMHIFYDRPPLDITH
jgi:hypothetical protein